MFIINPEKIFTKRELNEIKDICINIEDRIYKHKECEIIAKRINESYMDIPSRITSLSNVIDTVFHLLKLGL